MVNTITTVRSIPFTRFIAKNATIIPTRKIIDRQPRTVRKGKGPICHCKNPGADWNQDFLRNGTNVTAKIGKINKKVIRNIVLKGAKILLSEAIIIPTSAKMQTRRTGMSGLFNAGWRKPIRSGNRRSPT